MLDMPTAGSKYDDSQRKMAAVNFASMGVYSRVAQQVNIPERTLREWGKSEWWDTIVAEVRSENKDKHIAQYADLMQIAYDQCKDKLPEASARDAMIIMATAQDKARILQSLPNTYQGKAEGIEALAAQFRALSDSWEEKQVNVVETVDKVGDKSNSGD